MTGSALLVLLEVDPNLVRPGWTPLVVVVLLGIALFFLGRSMLRQFRKIDVPADSAPTAGDGVSQGPVAGAPVESNDSDSRQRDSTA